MLFFIIFLFKLNSKKVKNFIFVFIKTINFNSKILQCHKILKKYLKNIEIKKIFKKK